MPKLPKARRDLVEIGRTEEHLRAVQRILARYRITLGYNPRKRVWIASHVSQVLPGCQVVIHRCGLGALREYLDDPYSLVRAIQRYETCAQEMQGVTG